MLAMARRDGDEEGGIGDPPPAAGASHQSRRGKSGERRLPPTLAVLVAIALYTLLPERLLIRPRLLIPALEVALLIVVVARNPRRITRETRATRIASLALTLL